MRIFAFVSVGWLLLLAYLWWRFVRVPRLPRRATIAVGVIGGLVTVGAFLTWRRSAPPIPGLVSAGYIWLGLSFLLFWSAALFHVGELLVRGVARLRKTPLDASKRLTLSRIASGGAAALGLAAAGVGAVEARDLVLQRVKVPLKKLPPGLDGFKIAQISDLHVGRNIHRDYVAAIVARVNELAPDLIAITGDLVDGTVEQLREHVAPLADLKARFGVFFVTGNHEYYSGATQWVEHLPTLGIKVLLNERVAIDCPNGSFDLAGVCDQNAARYGEGHAHDPERALKGRDPAREVVLLAHQPKTLREAVRLGVGLQISGHTHGGQIYPLRYFLLDQPFVDGLHLAGETHIYVSRGAGYWGPPMRLAAPPEVALLELSSSRG